MLSKSEILEPIKRQTSSASSVLSEPRPLRHDELHELPPKPHDPSRHRGSLHRRQSKNVQHLEKSAEELSAGWSGVVKMNELSRSRQNSIQSERQEISVIRPRLGSGSRSRTGSHGQGVPSGRWAGGGGYVTSPIGSVSHHSSLSRVRSGSGSQQTSSRLAQVSEPVQEGRPLDSPLRPTFGVPEEEEQSREVSHSSFAQRYDEIAGQIEDSLQHVPPSPPKEYAQLPHMQRSGYLHVEGTATPPDRPRSTDTFQEAQIAFQDFDGVHFSPDTDEIIEVDEYGNEIRRVSARSSTGRLSMEAASLLRTPRGRPVSYVPPPDEGMVYYPAPVPKMLNLPKRLSQLPAASVQARRRSQMINDLPQDARAAGPWLDHNSAARHSRGTGSGDSGTLPKALLNERMSGNYSNLPAQLRANMFFEHQPVQHNVEVQNESAVATLDNILAASATAPVNAFTDHPFAGDVRRSVYSPEFGERKRHSRQKSSGTLATAQSSPQDEKVKKRRSSSIGALFKKRESSDQLKKRGSRASLMTDLEGESVGPKKLQKRRSHLSLGDELERRTAGTLTPGEEINDPEFSTGRVGSAGNAVDAQEEGERPRSRAATVMFNDVDQVHERTEEAESSEADDSEGEGEGEASFVQPSTLLAELQVRKAAQRSRNKTAATAYPQGMHSTLLQMDAVEEINKRKRKKQRIQLAWEDPHQRVLEDEEADHRDEDVPLGMLFPSQHHGRERGGGKKMLGLMEKREMEDSEPLSSRMKRLGGGRWLPQGKSGMQQANDNGSQTNLAHKPEEEKAEDSEHEGETLVQRARRMKTKEALDGTIAHVENESKLEDRKSFADDFLTQFGGLDVKDKEPDASAGAAKTDGEEAEEETLGQRRARLQREREAEIRARSSVANILSANPTGVRVQGAKAYQPIQGTLLHNNAQMQQQQKNQLMNANMRSPSAMALDRPLVDARQKEAPIAGGMLAAEQSRPGAGGYGGGWFNNGMGGVQLGRGMQVQNIGANGTPIVGMGGTNGYFASPTTAAMGYAGYGMQYPQQQQQQQQQQQMMGMSMQQHMYQPQQQYSGMKMANPYGMPSGWVGNATNPGMMGGTYASFAQQNLGPAGMAMALDEEGLSSDQRTAIDRWRMGVTYQ